MFSKKLVFDLFNISALICLCYVLASPPNSPPKAINLATGVVVTKLGLIALEEIVEIIKRLGE
jgi:hypothetical protein